MGQDLWSAWLHGARHSLLIALAVGLGAAAVGTLRGSRVDAPVAPAEHRHPTPVDLEVAPLPGWDLVDRAQLVAHGSRAHPSTGSDVRNWFAVAGASRSSQGSRAAPSMDCCRARSRSAQMLSLSSTTTARMRSMPRRSTKV